MIYKGKWAKGMMRWAATYDAIKTLSQKCGLLGLSLLCFSTVPTLLTNVTIGYS